MKQFSTIQDAIREQARKHNLDVATNDGYNRAYELAKRAHPELFAANDAPSKSRLSDDGQTLSGGWPVPPEKLLALGLPLQTTREAYQVFRLADETKLTGEIAAVVVRSLVQFSQLDRALSFDDAMEHVKKHRPEIYKLAREVAQSKTL